MRWSVISPEAMPEAMPEVAPMNSDGAPDALRGRQRLDRGDLRADPAAVLSDRDHHLRHAVTAGFPGVPVDQRP
jgi:hypothetical protein